MVQKQKTPKCVPKQNIIRREPRKRGTDKLIGSGFLATIHFHIQKTKIDSSVEFSSFLTLSSANGWFHYDINGYITEEIKYLKRSAAFEKFWDESIFKEI